MPRFRSAVRVVRSYAALCAAGWIEGREARANADARFVHRARSRSRARYAGFCDLRRWSRGTASKSVTARGFFPASIEIWNLRRTIATRRGGQIRLDAFRRSRIGDRTVHPIVGATIRFEQPVVGPIGLGRRAHFSLARPFRPVAESRLEDATRRAYYKRLAAPTRRHRNGFAVRAQVHGSRFRRTATASRCRSGRRKYSNAAR